ncbi:hypothetical protein VZT92_007241 [Zoarces viviparus]|uniref:Ig-like domain-containing protein n=1 Tax=Zoarces viviparus TaxID=48416 RepID=A0AAW1FJS2_ZOAVI
MSFSSDVMTRHVFGWVSILWLTSAVSIAASQGVTLETISQVFARCGDNVTLTCDASSSGDVKSFSWLAKNKSVCQYGDNGSSEFLCESSAQPYRLTLSLLNVMPVDQGTHICKLHSTSGAKSNTTHVTVQDCVGSYGSSINGSHAECWFTGVYPIGTVHWLQGDVNFTLSASTQAEKDPHGRFNVSSSIRVKKGNLNQPYECSLWIPSARKLLSSQRIPLVEKQIRSSGCTVTLQWICMMVGIMTFMV